MASAGIPLNFPPIQAKPELSEKERLAQLDRLATLLDAQWQVPGLKWRVGWDQILGLVPGVGDTLALLLSSVLVIQTLALKPPKSLLAKMTLNLGVDWAIGSIPILGTVFDILFPANKRNVKLLKTWLEAEKLRLKSPSR